jgi:hypothetical protein
MGRRQTVLQRRGETDELIPLLDDDVGINAATQQRLQRTIVRGAIDDPSR